MCFGISIGSIDERTLVLKALVFRASRASQVRLRVRALSWLYTLLKRLKKLSPSDQ